jgi:ankyrin repeat protein
MSSSPNKSRASNDKDDVFRDQVSTLVFQCLLQLCGGEQKGDHHGCSENNRSWLDLLKELSESTVQRAKQKQWNIEIRTAPTLFNRFSRNGILQITSSLGLERQVKSSYDLGHMLLLEFEEVSRASVCLTSPPSTWVRGAPNGMMYVTTEELLHELRSSGLSPCPHCPHWFKGLWWHIQQRHVISHGQAKEEQAKQNNNLAMIEYNPESMVRLHASLSKKETAAVEDKFRCENDDPWHCIKTGNVAGLKRCCGQNGVESFDVTTAVDDKGASPIHWAAGGGHLEILKYLLDKGCDPEVRQISRRSFGGRTALHWASRNGHLAVVQYLLFTCGVNALAETQDGTTAFGWAAWQGHLSVLQCLYAHSPSLSRSINRFGCNAALWAAQGPFGNKSDNNSNNSARIVMEWLESVGCNIFLVNSNGHGVLHKAAQRGNCALAEWFVERLVLLITNNDQGQLPVSLDQLVGPDTEGCTPSDLAGMEHHKHLAEYLARQEQKLILMQVQNTATKCPLWFDKAPPLAGSCDNVWEPWAGVSRMRAAAIAAQNS